MAETRDDRPLDTGSLAASEEALVPRTATRGGSNKRAFKIAGITTLACVLVASQVFTAYMVFDQKQQIHTLQRNSEKLSKDVSRASQTPGARGPMRMAMPMNTLPLLMDFTSEDKPSKKVEEPEFVNVEKQVMDLMKDSQLPHFNETFLANVQSLQQQMDDSEWKSFRSWVRFWLIFQMAQEEPAPPTSQPASVVKTKCQIEATAERTKIGEYRPQCDEEGRYKPIQCWFSNGFCWCVDTAGNPIQGTTVRGRPQCSGASAYAPRRMMVAPG
ncbi:CD74 molecule, major histocompatibility complex, class II invariant chain a [Acanthochromis polyacanthus]|uniref:CD74 molecule, major histocompatibility complex, class II invariant chain a n=1 Tax=Acanthochromis polyacanthus TaxID=80966 RepID=UPI002233E701|nr:CD74 molecule, major histocompatibility complex, class II invariant chain a [Acanthochromis polyacanthus]